MSLAALIVERKPFAGQIFKNTLAAASAALAVTGAAQARGIDQDPPLPPPPTLTASTASVTFNFGQVPIGVPRSANGGVSPDGLVAKFTGGLGPITYPAFAEAAPKGGMFRFGGGIIGGVQPGQGICLDFEIAVAFTGGQFKYGIDASAFVPNAGGYSADFSGRLSSSGVITGSRDFFFVVPSTRNGQYDFEFGFNWLAAGPDDTLTITIQTVRYEVCIIPSPGAAGVFVLAATAGATRRRRRA